MRYNTWLLCLSYCIISCSSARHVNFGFVCVRIWLLLRFVDYNLQEDPHYCPSPCIDWNEGKGIRYSYLCLHHYNQGSMAFNRGHSKWGTGAETLTIPTNRLHLGTFPQKTRFVQGWLESNKMEVLNLSYVYPGVSYLIFVWFLLLVPKMFKLWGSLALVSTMSLVAWLGSDCPSDDAISSFCMQSGGFLCRTRLLWKCLITWVLIQFVPQIVLETHEANTYKTAVLCTTTTCNITFEKTSSQDLPESSLIQFNTLITLHFRQPMGSRNWLQGECGQLKGKWS